MSNSSPRSWFGEYAPWTGGPAPDELVEIFAAEFSGIPAHRFPRAAEPMIVPLESYQSLLSATTRLLELQREAVARLASNSPGRLAALRADPSDFPRFGADNGHDERYEIEHCIDFSRADVVIGRDGPQFVEFNVGAGVGTALEFELERRVWERARREAGETPWTARDLFEQYAAFVKRTCADRGIGPSAVLIGSLEDPSRTTQYFDRQEDLLREFGVDARFVDLRSLRDEMDSGAGPADVLGIVQFCEREANDGGWDMSSLTSATKSGLFALPSQTARLVDSKKVLGLLSEEPAWMSAESRELVRRFVPWTRSVADRRVDWRGRPTGLLRLLLEEREHFVIKSAAGYSSKEVYFGATTPDVEWAALITAAVESDDFVAQEMVEPARHPIRTVVDGSGRTETLLVKVKASPFCIGGVATGCFMRFDPSEQIGPVARSYGAGPGVLLGAPR